MKVDARRQLSTERPHTPRIAPQAGQVSLGVNLGHAMRTLLGHGTLLDVE
ncbi:hypothetical protein [Paracoccus yeei]|nr:hypothetical protein [Paracoccus yeei]